MKDIEIIAEYALKFRNLIYYQALYIEKFKKYDN